MLIAVAGPYSADTPEHHQRNLDAMNEAAAGVMKLGHIPVIGVNAALPVVECLGPDANQYEAIMAISRPVNSIVRRSDWCAVIIFQVLYQLEDGAPFPRFPPLCLLFVVPVCNLQP